MSIAIESAASALAQARAEAAKAFEALDRANAAQGRVQARVDALGAERAAIVAAARSGASDAAAALRLSVIDADLADLAGLVAEHKQAVAKAQADAATANAAAVRAQQMVDVAADSELLGRLVEHASKLDTLFVSTLAELAAATKRIGGRARWAPTPALVNELQRLHLTANGIRR